MNIDIYQLSRLLSKQQVLATGLFVDGKANKKSKYLLLFLGIKDGKINSDKEAIQYLKYRKSPSFLKLKKRYLDKVLNYLLISDARIEFQDKTNDLYLELLKLHVAARFLHFHNQKKNAVIIYRYIFNKSVQNGFEDLIMFSAIPLKQHYAYIEPNNKLFAKYSEVIDQSYSTLGRTIELNSHYDMISHMNLILPESKVETFNKETLKISDSLLNGLKETDSFQYRSKVYEIASFAFNVNSEYEKSIDISKELIDLSLEYFKTTNTKVLIAYKDILSAYLKLKDYENAKIYIDNILEISNTHGHNYFRIRGLEFSLYAITKAYDKLFNITHEVTNLKKLKEYKVNREEWHIREAFVNVLVEAGKIDQAVLDANPSKKFKLNRFINDVEFYSKDKRGTNISIQIIQLMHFLIRKEYDKIVDRLDALNQYTYRYLRNDDTLRSNCFIKMLLKIPEAEYHPLRTKRYVAKYEKKLAENPYEISLKEISVEIIPYEYLWEIILEILDTNLKKK